MSASQRRLAWAAAGIATLLLAPAARSFTLFANPTRHPDGSFAIRAEITRSGSSVSPSGISWNEAFATAAGRWNNGTPLVDVGVQMGHFEDPCDSPGDLGDGENGVGFAASVCGDAFGGPVLGVARRLFTPGGLVIESNIVFKDDGSVDWDVFDGPLASQPTKDDFRRVAVHEIGHLLGLDHEDDLPAIMNSFVGDLSVPVSDDLDGLAALYDLDCSIRLNGVAGSVSGVLGVADGDCFDSEIGLPLPTLPSNPPVAMDSFADLYAVTLDAPATLSAELADDMSFNPVVQILDAMGTTQLAANWAGAGASALASAPLPAGEYIVVARSLFAGEGGGYTLTLTPEPASLGGSGAALAALAALSIRRRRRVSIADSRRSARSPG